MMLEMQQDARLTRCKNFMYVASFNPCPHEQLTEAQWERAFEIFEKHRGIPGGQQRIVIEHEKEGRTHRHVVWNRVDLEKMRACPDGKNPRVRADPLGSQGDFFSFKVDLPNGAVAFTSSNDDASEANARLI